MSSYICEPEHFNSVERKLNSLIQDNRFYFPEIVENKVRYESMDIESVLRGFLDAVVDLSVMCVTLQYKEEHETEEEINKQIEDGIHFARSNDKYKELSMHGLYNAVYCTRYQIEEEHLTKIRVLKEHEKSALKFLDDMINHLARTIVKQLPKDKTNKWSIEL